MKLPGKVFRTLYIRGKFLTLFVFILINSFILAPYFIDKEFYKNLILEEIQKRTDFKIEFEDSDLIFFPYPGIEFQKVQLSKEKSIHFDLEKIQVDLSPLTLLEKKLIFRKLTLHGSQIHLQRDKAGLLYLMSGSEKASLSSSTTTEDKPIDIDGLLKILPQEIELLAIQIDFTDDFLRRKIPVEIHKLHLDIEDTARSVLIEFLGVIQNNKLISKGRVSLKINEISYQSLRIDLDLDLVDFPLYLADDVLMMFPHADFRQATITTPIKILKQNDDIVSCRVSGNVKKLTLKGRPPVPEIEAKSLIWYSYREDKVGFSDIALDINSTAHLKGSGFVTFSQKPEINFGVEGSYLDVEPTLDVVKMWLDADEEKTLLLRGMPSTGYKDRMTIRLQIALKDLKVRDYNLPSFRGNFQYHNLVVKVSELHFQKHGGIIDATGILDFQGSIPTYKFEGTADDIDITDFLSTITTKEYITGSLQSKFKISSLGKSEEEILHKINFNGEMQLKDGELVGYANILRPLASLGKLINFTGASGKSTSFQTILTNLNYSNQNFHFTNLKMKGTGLDATGDGKIGMNKSIQMKITLSFPGVTGQALKLPILYSGEIGKNLPYIDPIWLGSVYAGTIFLAGPAGATIGGVAGSAVSEYVDKSFTGIRSGVKTAFGWFTNSGSDNSPEEKPNTEGADSKQ